MSTVWQHGTNAGGKKRWDSRFQEESPARPASCFPFHSVILRALNCIGNAKLEFPGKSANCHAHQTLPCSALGFIQIHGNRKNMFWAMKPCHALFALCCTQVSRPVFCYSSLQFAYRQCSAVYSKRTQQVIHCVEAFRANVIWNALENCERAGAMEKLW